MGKIYEVSIFESHGDIGIPLISFIFGGGSIYSVEHKKLGELYGWSGISLFGVIAFICLVVALVLFVAYICSRKEKLYIASCVSLILSGIFILFLFVVGTSPQGPGWNCGNFAELFKDFRLGTGTILWSLLCALGGAFGIYNALFVFKKK